MQTRGQFDTGVDAGRHETALKRAKPGRPERVRVRSRAARSLAAVLLAAVAALVALPLPLQAQAQTGTPLVSNTGQIQVRATNAEGDGAWSQSGTGTTTDAGMPMVTTAADLVFSPLTFWMYEGSDASYTVKLATQPTDTVTVTITGTAGTDLSLDKTSLTFTTLNWNVAQTVTVSADEDLDAENDIVPLTHTASGGDYGSVTKEFDVAVFDLDETALILTPVPAVIGEGEDLSYTVKLATQPTDTVTVTITGTMGTVLSLDKTSLTFTTLNWNVAQPVMLSAGEDDDARTASVPLTHTASGGNYESVSNSVTVNVVDNDERLRASLVIVPGSMSISEGTEVSLTVNLATQPTDTVTVTITGTTGTDVSLDKTSLTFTTMNWNVAQTVMVSAGEDNDTSNDTVALTYTASGGDYGSVSTIRDVIVSDNDNITTGLILSPGTMFINEGSATNYTVRLASQPTDTVTVTITGTAGTDLSLDKTSLTFTTLTWNLAQTVRVSAGEDDDAKTDRETLRHTASGGNYTGLNEDLLLGVSDKDTKGLSLSILGTSLVEGDNFSFTVRLRSQPTDTVTVTITGLEGTDLSLDKTSLTFTTLNWNVAQTVRVSAGEDDDTVDDRETLTLGAAGGDYAGQSARLTLSVIDNDDPPDVALSPFVVGIEEGTSADYKIKLTLQPTDTVTVTITGLEGTDLSLDKTSLTFTTLNWNVAQTVRVSAGEDEDVVDDRKRLDHTASGGGYDMVDNSFLVQVYDNDTLSTEISLSVSPDSLGEGASSTTVTVTAELNEAPRSELTTVTVKVGATEDSAVAGTDYNMVNDFTLTIGVGQTTGTANFQLIPTDDAINEVDEALTVSGTTTATGLTVDTTSVTIVDNDAVGVTVSKTALTVTEEDAAGDSYTVVLDTQPAADVTVTVTGHLSTDVTPAPATLTFTDQNWDTAQTVTVTAGNDVDAINDTVTLTHTPTGGGYDGVAVDSVAVLVLDDEAVVTIVADSPSAIYAEDSADFTLTRTGAVADPLAVTVNLTQSQDYLAAANRSRTVVFGPDSATATLRVPANQFRQLASGTVPEKGTLTATVAAGTGYDVGTPNAAAVDILIAATIRIEESSYTVSEEGGSPLTVTVVARTGEGAPQPTGTIFVTLGTFATGSATSPEDYQSSSEVLRFRSSDFTADGTVFEARTSLEITINDDSVVDSGETFEIRLQGAPGLHVKYWWNFVNSAGQRCGPTCAVTATITDTDRGVTVSATTLDLDEGDDATYTVVLDTQPTGTVTVTIGGTTGTDVSVGDATLEFTAGDWATAQTVTVSAAEDVDAINDTVTLTHTPTGGGYDGVAVDSVAVTVLDDEAVVTIAADSPSAIYAENSADFTLTRTGAVADPLAVTVNLTQSQDYLAAANRSRTVVFGPDSATATLRVPASQFRQLASGTVPEKGTLTATVAAGTGYDAGTPNAAAVDILIAATIRIEESSYTVSEEGGSLLTVTVVARTGEGAPQPTGTIFVTLGTFATGSATSPEDYQSSSEVLRFRSSDFTADGTVFEARTSLEITINDDSVVDSGETFEIRLQGAPGLHVKYWWNFVNSADQRCGPICAVTATITDTDRGVTVSATTLDLDEGDDATYTVVLDTQPAGTVTVTIGGTTGTDVSVGDATLAFTTTDWLTAQTVTVSAAEDSDTANDTVSLTHSAASTDSDYNGIAIAGVEVTVNDNDTAQVTEVRVVPGNAQLVVDWKAVDNATGYKVQWKSGAQDYNTGDRQATVTPGSTTSHTIGSLANGTEYTVRVIATRTGANDGPPSAEVADTPTMPIGPGVTVSATTLTVTEGTSATYTVVLDTQPTGPVTVTPSRSSGDADVTVSGALTFTPLTWSAPQTVTVTAGQDADGDDDAAVIGHAVGGADYVGVTAASVDVTVDDDETASTEVILTVDPAWADEGAALTRVRLTAELNEAPRSELTTVTVTVGDSGDSAVEGTDYQTIGELTLTIRAGQASTFQTILFRPVNTGIGEGDKGISITGTTTAPGLTVVGTVVALLDDEVTRSVTLSVVPETAAENGGPKTVVVTAAADTGPYLTDMPLTVTVGALEDSATEGTDYATAGDIAITIPAGGTGGVGEFQFTPVDDSFGEGDEKISITGRSTGPTAVVLGTELTIVDDDTLSTEISLSVSPDNLGEGAGATTLTVTGTLNNDPRSSPTSVTVMVGVSSDVAVEGTDYETVNDFTLTIDAGQTTGTADFQLIPTDDTTNEADEALTVSGTTAATGLTVITTSVTIEDDDARGVTVSATALDVDEDDTGTYTVVLTSQPTADVTVTPSRSSGDADVTVSGALTFTALNWSTAQTVTVSAAQDADALDDTAVIGHAVSGGDYAGVTAGSVDVTVDDDETPSSGVTLSVSPDCGRRGRGGDPDDGDGRVERGHEGRGHAGDGDGGFGHGDRGYGL